MGIICRYGEVKNNRRHLNMKGAVPRLASVFGEMSEMQQWPQDQEISHPWIFLFPEVCLTTMGAGIAQSI